MMKKLFVFFDMTENERKGFLVLLLLIVVLTMVPFVYRLFRHDDRIQEAIQLEVVHLHQQENAVSVDSMHDDKFFVKRKETTKGDLFPFNPNGLPKEKWQELGFSDKQIEVIKNYEAKGGRFRTPSDVAKIYVISAQEFSRIAPFLVFDEAERTQKKFQKPVQMSLKNTTVIDINLGDTTDFKELPGIGTVLAARIIKFRDALGGFHNIEQIKEVYGISEDLFEALRSRFKLNLTAVEQLSVNDLSAEQLSKHPYISKKVALLLVRYREQHGFFQSMQDIRQIRALEPDFLRKIEPYLNFNQ